MSKKLKGIVRGGLDNPLLSDGLNTWPDVRYHFY